MAKKSGGKTPVPDPVAITQAQSSANTQSAEQQAALNRVGTSEPYGTTGWSQDPSGQWVQNTTLNGTEQQAYDQQRAAQSQALQSASQSSYNLGALPGLQSSINGFGTIQQDIGPTDFTKDREAVTNAVTDQAFSRLNPQFQQEQAALDQKLANQGISINSGAYGNATDGLGRTQNDARNQAIYSGIQAGANEQNTLFGQALNQGQFHNAAQDQGFGQNAQQATFNNSARQQGFNEQTAMDQANLQRYATLMGAGNPSTPEGIAYTPTGVANTDVLGAYGLQQKAQQANAQAAQAQSSGLMGGLFSLGAAALAGPTGGLSLLAKPAMSAVSNGQTWS